MAISRWSQQVTLLGQVIQDPTMGFLDEVYARSFLKEGQRIISVRVKCLRREYSTTTVADQETYPLPVDHIEVDTQPQVDGWPTDYAGPTYTIRKTDPSGQARWWTIKKENVISLYPIPDASGDAIVVPYFRKTPKNTLHITRSTAGSCSAATVAVTAGSGTMVATTMMLVQTGATPGSYSIDLTGAAYDTLTELVTYINTLAGWTCTLDATCSGGDKSTLLEVISAADCYSGTTKILDEDMEIDCEFDMAVCNFAVAKIKELDHQPSDAAGFMGQFWEKVKESEGTFWAEKRKTGMVKRTRARETSQYLRWKS